LVLDIVLIGIVLICTLILNIVLVGIVLICTLVLDIVLAVHVLGDLLHSMITSLHGIVLIHSLGLKKPVDCNTREASVKFLGDLGRPVFLALVVKVLHGLVGGNTSKRLMKELRLVIVASVLLIVDLLIVDLLMSVLSLVYREISQSALSPAANGCLVDTSKSLTPAEKHIGWLFEGV
jgi:hypothetical protein